MLWEKEKLTAKEADRALAELVESSDETTNVDWNHVFEVVEQIKKGTK